MGGCVSHDHRNHPRSRRQRRRSHSSRASLTNNAFVGRNKPLNRSACRPKWKSDVPITENQLRRKREEYWDTAPAFEGRKEIWDALRGTCYALEQNDLELAQSILNCANISLPYGTLLDCYDELGTRYQLPVYVLSAPLNLIDGEQTSIDSRLEHESTTSDSALASIAVTDRERDNAGNQSSSSSMIRRANDEQHHNPILRRIKKHHRKHKSTADPSSSSATSVTVALPLTTVVDQNTEIPVKFRLSNGKEHRLYCKPDEKFRTIKKRLALLENGTIDGQTQRFFFGGQLLRDRSTVSATRLQRNFVVQVILNEPIHVTDVHSPIDVVVSSSSD